MAATPETSGHTSIKLRIDKWKQAIEKTSSEENPLDIDPKQSQPRKLHLFVGNYRNPMPKGILFRLIYYLELVDWTGRAVLHNKKGIINQDIPKIIQRLNMTPEHWIEVSTHVESRFKGLVGASSALKKLHAKFGLSRQTNRSNARLLIV